MRTYLILILLTGVLIYAGIRSGAFVEQRIDPEVASTNGSDPIPASRTTLASPDDSSCCQKSGCECCGNSEQRANGGQCANCPGTCDSKAADGGAGDGSCCVTPSSRAMAMISAAVVSQPSNEVSHQSDDSDWSMWGGTPDRNMISDAANINIDFDLREGTRVNWTATLGSQTYGNAIVAEGKVLVGTNNGGGYRADKYPADQDKGVVLCFDEASGEFLWQLTRDKLTIGRVCDWPLQGICSTPTVEAGEEGARMWVVTNRGELMCVDMEGMRNGNSGPVTDEVDATDQDADIIWTLDMINELGVFPHNLATSSPLVYKDKVYVLTSNGVDEAHLELPAPRAPSMVCVDKNTGKLIWEQNFPEDRVLHGQWSSPSMGIVNGQAQIYFPSGDGWLYALDSETGEEIWKFDLNPKDTQWELGGAGSRNAIISTAVFIDDSVIVGVGQDPEHGEGVGHLWKIDATKTGDVSAELGETGQPGAPNPNSAAIWHYGGIDETGDLTGEPGSTAFRRTISTVAIADGLVFIPDLSGFVHCVDLKTGKRHWEHDLLTAVWGSPMVVDGKVFLGVEDGKVIVFEATGEEAKIVREYDTVNYSSVYTTPTIANGRMYITDRTRLYSIDLKTPNESP